MSVDLSALTAEQKAELARQLSADLKAEENKVKEERKAYKAVVDEYVPGLVDLVVPVLKAIKECKSKVWKDSEILLDAKCKAYSTKEGGQDSHTFSTSDGKYSLTIGFNVKHKFDGTETAGIEKIKEYLNSLASDDPKAKILAEFLNTFLKADKMGNLKAQRIIELSQKKDEINDERFTDGINIIMKAMIRESTSNYIEGHYTQNNEDGTKEIVKYRL